MRTILYSLSILLLPFSVAYGALIIDNFDDPVQITVPEMENQRVFTTEVGELYATRGVRVASSQTDPVGFSDVNDASASTWITQIEEQTNMGSGPAISFGVRYDFDEPVDLTEGGGNDVLWIDFRRFEGPSYAAGPQSISAGALDGNNTFLSIVGGFGVFSESPFTLGLPFSTFGIRGSGGGMADFTTIERLSLTIRLINGNKNPIQGWHVEIDSIRVGRMVPEPSTIGMALLASMGCMLCFRVTRLNGEREGGDEYSRSLTGSVGIGRR